MAQKKRSYRQRKPRAARKAPRQSAKALEAQLAWKTRVVQLESRMTITELFLGIHADQPPLQTRVDEEE